MIPAQLKDMRFCKIRFKTKIPYEKAWQKNHYSYSDISPTLEEGRDNYGVLTGINGLGVLDDDSEDKILMKLYEDNFGDSFRVRDHYYICLDGWDGKKIIFFNGDKHLGELQGLGQQVVGCNSVHPSGEPYDLRNDTEIKTIEYTKFAEVFKNYIKSKEVSAESIEKNCNYEDDNLVKQIKDKWNKGDRQNLALSLSGYLRKNKRLGLDSALSIIESICIDCKDTDIEERKKAVRETYAKDENKVKGISGLFERDIKVESVSVKDFLYSKGISKKTGKEEFAVDIDKVADYIQHRFEVRTIYGLKEETIELYEDGIWSVTGKGVIKAEIEYILKKYSKNNAVSEILEKVKRRSEVTREEADNIPDYKRCVEDGVLDIEDVNNIKLLPHSKEYNFRHKFPMKYNPIAKCPNNLKFINEAFYKEDVPVVQEWIGFHLPRKYCFKNAVVIHGPKNTSKTVFVNLLTSFVGNNVSGLSLQEISGGKAFDLLALKDKDANIYDDLSSSDMDNVGGFKMAVGDGWISGEQKFGDKIRFRNTAKDTNTCNDIPSPKNDIDDMAYYERITLLPMDNVIEKENRDKDLIEKLTTPEELSGLLNWAIEGWKRLVTQNEFSNYKTPEETKSIMIKKGNSLAKFASEVLIHEDGQKVEKDVMYKIYCKWCMDHKPQLSPDTKDKIGKTLTRFAPYTQASSTGKIRYWSNVKVTDTYDTFSKSISDYNDSIKEDKNDDKNNIYKFQKGVIPVSKITHNCKLCKGKEAEEVITDLSKKQNQKLIRCKGCKAIISRIPLNSKELDK